MQAKHYVTLVDTIRMTLNADFILSGPKKASLYLSDFPDGIW